MTEFNQPRENRGITIELVKSPKSPCKIIDLTSRSDGNNWRVSFTQIMDHSTTRVSGAYISKSECPNESSIKTHLEATL